MMWVRAINKDMKKIWIYVSVFLTGFSIALIIAWKWLDGKDYSIEIKKLKQKGIGGDSSILIPVNTDRPSEGVSGTSMSTLEKWKRNRSLRKAARYINRTQRKKERESN